MRKGQDSLMSSIQNVQGKNEEGKELLKREF